MFRADDKRRKDASAQESGMQDQNQTFLGGWHDRLTALRNIPPVLKIVWESGKLVVTLGLLARIVVSVIPVGVLKVASILVGLVTDHAVRHQPLSPYFWDLVGLEFGLTVLGAVSSRMIGYYDTLLADRYSRYVSIMVLDHASKLDLQTYENPKFYDLLERARVQATDRLVMIQATGQLVQQAITTVTLAVFLLQFSPWLLLLLVAFVTPAFLGESHYAFLGYSLSLRQTPRKRKIDYLRILGGSKEAAKELKLFGLRDFIAERFRKLWNGIYEENISLARRRFWAGTFLSTLSSGGYYGAYVFVLYGALNGKISIADMVFLTGTILQISNNIQSIFSTLAGIADQALYLTDLLAFFNMKPKVLSKPDALLVPRPIRQGFEFRNVSFWYPGTERRILDGFNMRIEPGERIALIGENGQGKTTIVKLLSRLYDPNEGTVLLDGIDLREYSIEDLCSEIGVIFQDFMRYEMTAAENIAVGRIEKLDDRASLENAAHKSMADLVIAKLAGGYDQMLGRRFESGVDLSGGEWQRLALARAYLRDAQMLILDEPTAALDARAEYEVFERFYDLTIGKMTLLISHRFSTVRMADRIVVLEGGRIVEEGKHDKLVQLGGRYAEMFELQASSYR
jgi:ATP-binding cassette, subfamily B, bacterial